MSGIWIVIGNSRPLWVLIHLCCKFSKTFKWIIVLAALCLSGLQRGEDAFQRGFPQDLETSSIQQLQVLTSPTKQRRLRSFEEVNKCCCNSDYGHEDMAGCSPPAQSSSFCNQLPECCASQEIRAASHERWLSNPAQAASPEIRVALRGPKAVGYREKQHKQRKQWGTVTRTSTHLERDKKTKISFKFMGSHLKQQLQES